MATQHDRVTRSAAIIDGSGGARCTGDPAIGSIMAKLGRGMIEMASGHRRERGEFGWMAAPGRETGLPLTFSRPQSIARERPRQEQMAQTARASAAVATMATAAE